MMCYNRPQGQASHGLVAEGKALEAKLSSTVAPTSIFSKRIVPDLLSWIWVEFVLCDRAEPCHARAVCEAARPSTGTVSHRPDCARAVDCACVMPEPLTYGLDHAGHLACLTPLTFTDSVWV